MGHNEVSEPLIQFLGAAGTVTGSRFLLQYQGTRVLVDCGMFQGIKELREMNWDKFPVDPASIDAILITHAHLDHSGFLPRLVKLGFQGAIYLTHYTGKL
jgi:metallo-beta-lactamase family protein